MARMLEDVISLLNRLIALEYDAIEAYKAASARVSATGDRAHLAEFIADHRRHVTELGNIVRNFGGEPTSHGDLRQVVTKGKVLLGGLSGESAVLEAMHSNEIATTRAYEDAMAMPGVPVDVLAMLERQRDDERRHRDWIERRIGSTTPRIGVPVPSKGSY
jgi:uncharacterized protein (TIGR02284 family)